MATRAPRKSLSTDDYKAKLAKAKEALKALEEKAYASELEELIKKQNIVSSFKVIQANTKGVSDLQILSAIGKAVGIKRLSIMQTEPKPRAKKSK